MKQAKFLLYNRVKGNEMTQDMQILLRLIAKAEVKRNLEMESNRVKELYELGIIRMAETRV